MPHTITHIEIPAPSLDSAIRFYSEAFDWKIEIINDKYAFFMIGNTSTGGGLDATLVPAAKNCGPQVCIDVDHIDETLGKIESLGGSIIMPKTEIPDGHGFYACFQDPNHNYLQIHSRE